MLFHFYFFIIVIIIASMQNGWQWVVSQTIITVPLFSSKFDLFVLVTLRLSMCVFYYSLLVNY